MSTAAVILAAACSWNSPGVDAYQGNVPTAVHRYRDIPELVRFRLQARMEKLQYDDVAVITRDGVQGRHEYVDLRLMHFGQRKVCGYVDRSMWQDRHSERGLVYCEGEHCLIVPTVCRNVARVTRLKAPLVPPVVPAETPPMVSDVRPMPLAAAPVLDVPAPQTVAEAPVEPKGPSMRVMSFALMASPVPVATPIYLAGPLPVVSEPATWMLALFGLAMGLLVWAWKKGCV